MVERTTLNRVVAGSIPAVGVSVDSSMVRIRAFQARGPGSIPGRRTLRKGLWCNWLARRTLNPSIRVQIPVGPRSPSLTFPSQLC